MLGDEYLKTVEENWVPLKDNFYYEINRNGKVRSVISKKELTVYYRNCERAYVALRDRDRYRNFYIDELVVHTFFDKYDLNKGQIIRHIDGDFHNCSVDNLILVEDDSAMKAYYEKGGKEVPEEYFKFYPIEEFPDSIYEINKVGQVRNKNTLKLLKGCMNSGYLKYTLWINNKMYNRQAHIMVAKQFIPNPDNKPIVNHIDEHKDNPCIDNLEWVTISDNILHGTALSRGNIGRNKPINEYSLQGKYIRTWKSITSLALFLNQYYPNLNNKGSVQKVLLNNSKEDRKKLPFLNRVFTYYEGNCVDRNFQLGEHKVRKYTGISMDEMVINSQYIYKPNEREFDPITVLKHMKGTKNSISYLEKQAIDYAIECITKVEEMYRKN